MVKMLKPKPKTLQKLCKNSWMPALKVKHDVYYRVAFLWRKCDEVLCSMPPWKMMNCHLECPYKGESVMQHDEVPSSVFPVEKV